MLSRGTWMGYGELMGRKRSSGLQPFFNNRQNFGSERNNGNPMYRNPQSTGPYKFQQPNYNNQNPQKNLDNVSMENNPSNLSKSKSNRSGFDQQFMVSLTRIRIKRGSISLRKITKSTPDPSIIPIIKIGVNNYILNGTI